jgi:hypothetical protein
MRHQKLIYSRKDRKYNLIIPFWLDTMVEASICISAINLGAVFSIQICLGGLMLLFG